MDYNNKNEPIGDSCAWNLKLANCDQEANIKRTLETAIRMALKLKSECHVRADDNAFQGALEGLINGTAIELLYDLSLIPSYINLKKVNTITDGLRGTSTPLPTSHLIFG